MIRVFVWKWSSFSICRRLILLNNLTGHPCVLCSCLVYITLICTLLTLINFFCALAHICLSCMFLSEAVNSGQIFTAIDSGVVPSTSTFMRHVFTDFTEYRRCFISAKKKPPAASSCCILRRGIVSKPSIERIWSDLSQATSTSLHLISVYASSKDKQAVIVYFMPFPEAKIHWLDWSAKYFLIGEQR